MKNMRCSIGSILMILVAFLGGCSDGKVQNEKPEIVIASANPMSGNSSDSGQMKVKAIQLAFDEVNAAGGINGRKLKLLIGDDAGAPKEAHKLATKLVADPNVLAVIGHWNSASTVATRNVYNGAGVPVLTDSVKKIITDGTTPYLFRILPSDQSEAEKIAEYVFHKLHIKKIAIIYVNNDYSVGMKDYFSERIQRIGGEVTAVETFFEGRTGDFTAELKKIKNSEPDGIFISGYYVEVAQIAREARSLGINLPIICPNGINSEELIHLGGAAVEGIKFNGFFYSGIKQNGSEEYAKNFKIRYGIETDTFAALAYDSAHMLINAIRKNGASREGIYQYLVEMKEYPGVAGTVSFDATHDAEIKMITLTVKDGKIVPDTIQP
jgi:branched-chain amino acid transport system substrate-binding protein